MWKKITLNVDRQLSIFLVLGVLLALLLERNICENPTVWELGDEAMYIWNAAYLLDFDWSAVQYNAYYGFGYSLFLLPSFFWAETGVDIIRWAYYVNLFFAVGTYVIIALLVWEISHKNKSVGIPVIAFIVCVNPMIFTSEVKVMSELCLLFFYCLVVLLFNFAVTTQKYRYYLSTAFVCTFAFFVHTRFIVIIMLVSLLLFAVCIKVNGKTIKQFLCYMVICIASFAMLYMVKQYLMNGIIKNAVNTSGEMANIIKSSFLIDRIKWIFQSGVWNYIGCFLSKSFYTVYETGGMVIWAICYMLKCIKSMGKNYGKKLSCNGIKLTVILITGSCLLMIIASTATGIGGDTRYVFYGRYFEYTIPLLMACGIYYYIYLRQEKTEFMCGIWGMTVFLGIIVMNWCRSYLTDRSVSVDTNRLMAFSRAIMNGQNLEGMLQFLIVTISFCLAMQFLLYKFKGRIIQFIPVLLIMAMMWDNCRLCMETVHQAHMSGENDTKIAEYIYRNYDGKEIVMVDDKSYHYELFYARMQVLLFDKKLRVQSDKEGIAEGDYVILYNMSEMDMAGYELLMKGSIFKLYRKNL